MATNIKGDNTMSEDLQRAIEAAQQLPHDLQSVIAERILEEIEEMEWDAIVSKPHVQKRLSDLADKAWENHLAGKTVKGGFKRLNSYCDEEFWKLFAGLPSHVQKQANNAYAHFKRDILHPSLHFKCINKKKQLYSVRIGKDYRAVGRKNNDTIV